MISLEQMACCSTFYSTHMENTILSGFWSLSLFCFFACCLHCSTTRCRLSFGGEKEQMLAIAQLLGELLVEDVRYDGVVGRAEVYKQDPGVRPWMVEVLQDEV
ncbi:hypothetical protein CHARACLAT_033032 [Characodon lateralis]|uniref:Uncharacterized protein n=1 Tax=Characodon lateralis TaxID=208331 RepID=A0ABU7DCQ0_9TELE|nr:hypothetical protein [Characodon lateralis]